MKHQGLWFAAAIIALVPAGAMASCDEPDAPSCASDYGSFESQDDFQSCRQEMDSYKSDVEDFLECNNREAQKAVDHAKAANDEATSNYNDAVRSFNDRARN